MFVSTDPLIVIGAGPKAMAIAAKSVVLKRMGFDVPKVHIIERSQVGAHWKGSAGFTNGKMSLGTSPEKDIGFPYQSKFLNEEISKEVDLEMWKFSWQAFLIDSGEYATWVDKGKPAPNHSKWADYLSFVAAKLSGFISITYGDVTCIDLEQHRWKVLFKTTGGDLDVLYGQGLVVTGPGKSKQSLTIDPQARDRVFDLETFWKKIYVEKHLGDVRRVAIIGAGENAASTVLALNEAYSSKVKIDVISPSGALFTRGESYFENRVYTNAKEGSWTKLSLEDRREFVRRTDLGVFSVHAMAILNGAENVSIVPGRAIAAHRYADSTGVSLEVSYNESSEVHAYDAVILATGFDQVAFVDELLSPEVRSRLEKAGVKKFDAGEVSQKIAKDLSLANFCPKLHLPMVAGLAQGPGFANLSSLGRLADEILHNYIHQEEGVSNVHL